VSGEKAAGNGWHIQSLVASLVWPRRRRNAAVPGANAAFGSGRRKPEWLKERMEMEMAHITNGLHPVQQKDVKKGRLTDATTVVGRLTDGIWALLLLLFLGCSEYFLDQARGGDAHLGSASFQESVDSLLEMNREVNL